MAELQRLSPPLWGLAEAARLRGDHDAALVLCERGRHASADVADAAYLFPYLLTGVRAHLARGDADAAHAWSERAGALIEARAIPGTLPAIGHARGLVLLARGDASAARSALEPAAESWRAARRFWEGAWALLDLAEVAAATGRHAEAGRFLDRVRAGAARIGAVPSPTPPIVWPAVSPMPPIARRALPAAPPDRPAATGRELPGTRSAHANSRSRSSSRAASPTGRSPNGSCSHPRRSPRTSSTSSPNWGRPAVPRSPPGVRRSAGTRHRSDDRSQ
nr:hypothetical protein GCM10020093_011160 [Planobispora longispora]